MAVRLCLVAVALVAALAFACDAGSSPDFSDTLAFQIHSWDDLREWPQLFHKDYVTWLKVDPHYTPAGDFCASQGSTDPRGCFVLLHNTPSNSEVYNTPADMMSFLVDPSNAVFFDTATRIHIALCVKLDGVSPCDGSSTSKNYLSLFSEVIANATVVSEQVNVGWVLDGSAVPSKSNECLKDLWEPYPATWDIDGDPLGAQYSNDTSKGYDRFQVLDLPIPPVLPTAAVSVLAAEGYAKFSDLAWPYLVWEPSDQKTIQEVCDVYLGHSLHYPAGLRFAINIDPAQWQVYAAPKTGTAWNAVVTNATAAAPIVTVLPGGPPLGTAALIAWVDDSLVSSSTGALLYASLISGSPAGRGLPPPPSNPQAYPGAPSGVSVLRSFATGGGTYVLAASKGGQMWLSAWDSAAASLSAVTSASVNASASYAVDAFGVGQIELGDGVLALVGAWGGSPGCSLSAALFNATSLRPLTQAICVSTDSADIPVFTTVVAASAATAGGVCTTGTDGVAVVQFGSADAVIHSAVVCFDLDSFEDAIITGPAPTGVGVHPSSDLVVDASGTAMLMAVHGEGYCWNSETHNKQASPRTCDQTPSSTPYILNYSYGSVAAWHASIGADASGPITACSPPNIIHGMYDAGSNPAVALGPGPGNGTSVAVVAVHEGLPSGATDAVGCGFPVANQGAVVLDSFPVGARIHA